MRLIKKLFISIVILSCVSGVLILVGFSLDGDEFLKTRNIDRYGKQESYDNETMEEVYKDLNELRINATYRDIYIQKSKDDDLHLEYNETSKIETDVENGVLEINEYNTLNKQNIGFRVDGIKNFILYGSFEKPIEDKVYIKVFLPEKALEQITAVNDVGSICVEKINAKGVDLSNSYGEIKVKTLIGEEISLTSDVGDLYGENIKADKMTMTVDYGECTVKNSDFDELNMTSDVGEANFQNLNIKNSLSVTTDTGEIEGALKIDKSKFYNIMANSSVGDVKIDSSFNEHKKDAKDMIDIHLESDVGDIRLKAK